MRPAPSYSPVNGPSADAVVRPAAPRVGLAIWLLVLAIPGRMLAQNSDTESVGNIRDDVPSDADFRRKIQLPYRDALKRAQPDRQAKKLIEDAVHYYMWLQADPSQALNRTRNRKKLMDDFRFSSTTEGAREYGYQQIILRSRQLFAEKDAEVRVAACHVLKELNVSWNPDIPYAQAADALIETLAFPDDGYIQVKVVAAPGVGRILRDSPLNALPSVKRAELADRLAKEIERLRSVRGQPGAASAIGHQWAMWALVGALGNSDRVYNQARQPVIVDALLGVLYDPGEDWLARARTARALSRLPYEGTSDLSVLNYDTAKLTRDMAQRYNADLAGGIPWPMWRRVALQIYLAYESEGDKERARNIGLMYQVNRGGLGGAKPQIEAARTLVLPIVNEFIKNPNAFNPPKIPSEQIDNLTKWLSGNTPPANAKLVPESKVQRPAPPAAQPAGDGA